MKLLLATLAFVAAIGCVTPVRAQNGAAGLYVGGGGGLSRIGGTGEWGGDDFSASNLFPTEEGEPPGLAWTDHLLLGITPSFGYEFNGGWALQVGVDLNIPKTSQQTFTEYGSSGTYEDSATATWTQRGLEVLGVFHPGRDRRHFFYAGLTWIRIDVEFSSYQGYEFYDYVGNQISDGAQAVLSDVISATGLVFGGGIDFPSSDGQHVVFLSAEYTAARTQGSLFDVEGFDVDVGGFAVMVGVRWFPFR